MGKGLGDRCGAALPLTCLAVVTVPACVIRIGPGDGSDSTGTDPGQSDPGDPQIPEPAISAKDEAEADFAEIDPQEFALAQAKSSLTTAYLVAQVESSGVDPNALDTTAIEELMQEHLPAASAWADEWIATLDPATLPQWHYNPECEFDHGCASRIPCKHNAPPVPHTCHITDCGKSNCSYCPAWITDLLKSLVLTSWCGYVCVELNKPGPNNVVAIGAGGISAFKGNFVGPICVEPW